MIEGHALNLQYLVAAKSSYVCSKAVLELSNIAPYAF